MFTDIMKKVEKLEGQDNVSLLNGNMEKFSPSKLEVQRPLCMFQDSYGVFDPFEKINFEGMAPNDSEQINLISDFINGFEDIQLSNWNELSIDQKIEILNSIDEKIADITKRIPCRIEAAILEENLNGVFYSDGRICLNQRLLNDNSKEGLHKCLETFLHEGRHAYQNYNLNMQVVEQNSERVKAWRLNYEMGYENGESSIFDYKNMGFKRYLTQPVEVDARVFAESVLNKLNF